MATGAPAFEDFIPLLRSGDALISRIALSGWQATASTLRTWSDRGRLWGTITPTSGDGHFKLYRRPGLAAGDLVCQGVIANNAVTLVAANSSGISGSADVPQFTEGDTQLFDLIVSYGDENDIASVYASAADELDANSKWQAQGTRFEALLLDQKRFLDSILWSRIEDSVGTDVWGRPRLGFLSDPRQYARVHALLCASQIYATRASLPAGTQGMELWERAKEYKAMAMQEFNTIKPLMDSNRDMQGEGFENLRSLIVRRA